MNKRNERRVSVKEYQEMILSKVREVMHGDRFKEFLLSPDTLLAFRQEVLEKEDYSFCNRLTLALFGARAVAGYKTWLNMGFHVRKGNKGIPIYRPILVTAKNGGESQETEAEERIETPEENGGSKKLVGFDVTHVFDISQVGESAGERHEKLRRKTVEFFQRRDNMEFCRELAGGDEPMAENIQAWLELTYPVSFERILSGAKGYTDGKAIFVKESMSPAQNIKTMLHEGAHCRLKHPSSNLSREAREIQAESAAFIAANKLGLDTSSYSFDYLASWGNQILKAEKGAAEFRKILQAAIEEGNLMAEEFKEYLQGVSQSVPEKKVQAAA